MALGHTLHVALETNLCPESLAEHMRTEQMEFTPQIPISCRLGTFLEGIGVGHNWVE